MAIVEEVRDELTRQGRDGAAKVQTWLAESPIGVRGISVGDSAATAVFRHLQADAVSVQRNRGERASIALAASDPSLVLVANDKGALWVALHELWQPGERVVTVPVFLRRLCDVGSLARPAATDLVNLHHLRRPTWWADWVSQPEPGGGVPLR